MQLHITWSSKNKIFKLSIRLVQLNQYLNKIITSTRSLDSVIRVHHNNKSERM